MKSVPTARRLLVLTLAKCSNTVLASRRRLAATLCLWLLASVVTCTGTAEAQTSTCAGNCNLYIGTCGCDEACRFYNDCCPDYAQFCSCGDGVLDAGEACDDAYLNGSVLSCCRADCTFRSSGTCDLGYYPSPCSSRSGVCQATGECMPSPVPAGAGCSGSACSSGACDGAGECIVTNLPAGTGCGGSACSSGACDGAGECIATSLPAGTDCGVAGCSGGACDGAGQCIVTDLPSALDCDGDGTADCVDGCPKDPAKTAPGGCGCGVPEGTCTAEPGHCSRSTCGGYVASGTNSCGLTHSWSACRSPAQGCFCDVVCGLYDDCCPGFDVACGDKCGDGLCGSSEDQASCPTDCGLCNSPATTTTTTTTTTPPTTTTVPAPTTTTSTTTTTTIPAPSTTTTTIPVAPTTTTTLPIDAPLTKSKLVILDMLAASGKAKITYVAKGPAAAKGTTDDPTRISARLQYQIAALGTSGEAAMPQGAGWIANTEKGAKYVNRDAPTAGAVQNAVVSPGKLLKVALKGLGDTGSQIDVYQGGAVTTPVDVAIKFTVVDGADTVERCSTFTDCVRSLIAGGQGAKVVCNSVAPVSSRCP